MQQKQKLPWAIVTIIQQIIESYNWIRLLLWKYDENIEVVDPQLKNNPELVELMEQFEKSWSKGKEFLMSPDKFKMIQAFSTFLEQL